MWWEMSFPYVAYFFMWAVFSLHVGVIFPCVRGGGGGSPFCMGGAGGGGGGGELLGITIFARAFCCHIFYCTDFIIFPDRGGLNFLRELFDPPRKLPPSPPSPPAPTKINNFCPLPSHGQHFRFSHYYHFDKDKENHDIEETNTETFMCRSMSATNTYTEL